MIYTPSNIAYVQAHYNIDLTAEQIAAHLGTKAKNLHSNVDRLKKLGHEFSPGRKPIGTVVNWGGRVLVKCENGYKRVGAQPKRRYEVGEYRTQTRRNGKAEIYLKTADGWEYQGTGKLRGKPAKEKRAKIAPKISQTIKDTQKEIQAAHDTSKCVKPALGTKGRNPTAKTRSRPHVTNTENPNQVTVKEQTGGHWVRLNEKTIAYRKTA